MRRDHVQPDRTKPAPPIVPHWKFARPQQFAFDAREACRGRRMRKSDLPVNPYDLEARDKP